MDPEDTDRITGITIPSCKLDDEKVGYYYINVMCGVEKGWHVVKRYSQFEEFHAMAVAEIGFPAACELPAKRPRWLISHVDPEFMEERRCLFESYLKILLKDKHNKDNQRLFDFLSTDKKGALIETTETSLEAPSDVEVTSVGVPSTRAMTDHVLYQIDVVNCHKRKTFSKWTVLKRFTQVHQMDAEMRETLATESPSVVSQLPPCPPRQVKIFFDHMDDAFIEQRRALLQNYFNRLIRIPTVVRHPMLLNFLGVE